MKYILSLLTLLMLAATACTPYEDEDIALPAPSSVPTFTVEFVNGDSNRIIVKNTSSGFFDHTFDLPGGIPARSKRSVDTVLYTKAGDYAVTLYASAQGGSGVTKNTKIITIAKDAKVTCDPMVSLLTGDCDAPGKCWTFSHAAEAIRVGPVPGSEEWYKSPVNGLQSAQYDDRFCFYFEGGKFEYLNNGQTVDPWNGYAAVGYTPPTGLTWLLSKGTGDGGKDQIILPAGAFIGTWDSGPVYDIAQLTETELVIRSRLTNKDGTPGTGWFEFTLVKN